MTDVLDCNFEKDDYSHYTLDLDPSDYPLFAKIKKKQNNKNIWLRISKMRTSYLLLMTFWKNRITASSPMGYKDCNSISSSVWSERGGLCWNIILICPYSMVVYCLDISSVPRCHWWIRIIVWVAGVCWRTCRCTCASLPVHMCVWGGTHERALQAFFPMFGCCPHGALMTLSEGEII